MSYKSILVQAIRILVVSAAMTLVVPLILPGASFTGSFFSGLVLGGGLWLSYLISSQGLKKAFGIGKGACPHPSLMKYFLGTQVLVTVAYLALAGMVIVTPFTVTGVFSLLIASVLTLVGATVSNIIERVLGLS